MKQYLPIAETGVPILFWGQPGTGKSSGVHSWADSHQLPCVTLVGSLSDPGDVVGFAVQSGDRVKFALPEWVDTLAHGGILFLDEINRGCRLVRSAMLRLIAERSIHHYKLPDNVIIIAAANSDGEVDDIDSALSTRFLHLDWSVDTVDYVRQLRSNQWDTYGRLPADWESYLPSSRDAIATFLESRSELLLTTNTGRGSGSPRTWDYAAKVLAGCQAMGLSSRVPLGGVVGEGPAKEYSAWYSKRDLPSPEAILAGQWKPGSRDQQRAALLSILPLVKDNNSWLAAWKQVVRVRKDIALLVARSLASRRPENCEVPEGLEHLEGVL